MDTGLISLSNNLDTLNNGLGLDNTLDTLTESLSNGLDTLSNGLDTGLFSLCQYRMQRAD